MKMDITKIDPNFLMGSTIDKPDVVWMSATDAPLSIHGLAVAGDGKFWRLPEDLIDNVNEGVCTLARHTAGGRIRFRTDSPYIAYRAKSFGGGQMSHMPLTGSNGTDLFVNGVSYTTFRPGSARDQWFEGCSDVRSEGMNSVELNLGLYNGYTEIYVGVKAGSVVEAPLPYALEKPVVYYGSSITQGGCASKPGNSYEAFIGRWLNVDHINLGFSGSGRGEVNIAEYIASLPMSAFVLDYDHNAPNVEHLSETHYRFYSIVRKAQPDLPIIMVSMPDTDRAPADADRRREVIMGTYLRARSEGDTKVWFVDGRTLFGGRDRDACTMDGCHPNDLGFYRMAEGILPAVRAALGL